MLAAPMSFEEGKLVPSMAIIAQVRALFRKAGAAGVQAHCALHRSALLTLSFRVADTRMVCLGPGALRPT